VIESNGFRPGDLPTWSKTEANDVSDEVAPGTPEPAPAREPTVPESAGAGDEIPGEAPTVREPKLDSDRSPAEDTIAYVNPIPPRDDARPGQEHDGPPPVHALSSARKSTIHRLAFVSLAALVGLVWLFAGRRLRRPV
jgi:hypothetical protein